jgi:hypothetical protein
LIEVEPRPSRSTVPSSATVARSPVMSQRSPSSSRKVAAVFSGSLR